MGLKQRPEDLQAGTLECSASRAIKRYPKALGSLLHFCAANRIEGHLNEVGAVHSAWEINLAMHSAQKLIEN